jgi:hypothetical protein
MFDSVVLLTTEHVESLPQPTDAKEGGRIVRESRVLRAGFVASIVNENVPSGAELVAENETVTAHVGPHGLLVKNAVTPAGSVVELTEKPTEDGEPATNVAVIVEASLVEPWTTVKLLGDGMERSKSNPARTVRDMLVELVARPPVP